MNCYPFRKKMERSAGSALVFTMVMTSVALIILAGALSWSGTNTKQIDRANGYARAVAAAEAASENVVSQVAYDFLNSGDVQVVANASTYRTASLRNTVGSYWNDWEFSDAIGHTNRNYVQVSTATNYTVLESSYAGLQGFVTTCTIIANARQPAALNAATGGVYQKLQLAKIPIFQFAMYTSGDMEISCGQPFVITGRVHSNGQLYVENDTNLTFMTDVTAVGDILNQRSPLDSRTPPAGVVTYQGAETPHVPAMTLPIGTSNTPTAVREIIEPPGAESATSALGKIRYYNQVDMIITVLNATNFTTTSGRFNNFITIVTNSQAKLFVSITNSFYDKREDKTVAAIDLDVNMLRLWCATNGPFRTALSNKDVSSVYVWDRRTLAATSLSGVRVKNGTLLPSRGLTIATASPLYVWGDFNQTNSANLLSTNTITTLPASLAGDAITFLSNDWKDDKSFQASAGNGVGSDLNARSAKPTTINAAILAGAVETVQDVYGGGMENFPRFLESWGSKNELWYNGSMVKMFPSLYATNSWGKDYVYDPPARNWSYDRNFDVSTKLPPNTPSVLRAIRSVWGTVAANNTNAPPSNL